MEAQVNNVAVLVAAVSSMVIGAWWYSPAGFGKQWSKLSGVTQEKMKASGNYGMVLAVVRSLLTAYVLAHVVFLSHHFFGNSLMMDSLRTGFFVWLGFLAAPMAMRDAFEGKRKKLTLLNVANEFVILMVMALVIGLIK
jgi:TRAP-type C4-dicarboxylate transport system permease small subunit